MDVEKRGVAVEKNRRGDYGRGVKKKGKDIRRME